VNRLGPEDPGYRAVVDKRFNKRFAAHPDYVQLLVSTEQVAAALAEAVRSGPRVVVTSGGHCLEGFVADPDVRVILDISQMNQVYFDAEHGAVAVEAGATVGQSFQALAERWGTVVPLGEYPGSGWVVTARGVRLDFSAASSVSRRTTSMRWRSSRWTGAAGRQPSSRRGSGRIPIGSFGGPTPAAGAATSAIRPGCCRATRSRSRRSRPIDSGTVSTSDRFVGSSRTTAHRASGTAPRLRRTRRCGRCCRCIANNSGRSSSGV
jgi:hypothetical protein